MRKGRIASSTPSIDGSKGSFTHFTPAPVMVPWPFMNLNGEVFFRPTNPKTPPPH